MNININPVRDYRSGENRCHKASHAVRYATCMLKYGCIPYGMQGLHGIQFSTERYIPMECSTNYNSLLARICNPCVVMVMARIANPRQRGRNS